MRSSLSYGLFLADRQDSKGLGLESRFDYGSELHHVRVPVKTEDLLRDNSKVPNRRERISRCGDLNGVGSELSE